jgi:hypothetical protein
MTLRIVDSNAEVEAAWEVLGTTLRTWAGENNDAWQRDGLVDNARERGDMFWRRDDFYVFLYRSDREFGLGVSLTERDRDLLRVAIDRREPARDRRKFAVAKSPEGETFLLVALEQLRRQNIRDALTRLPGVAAIKRATISNRDFLLIGPMSDPRMPDALVALIQLSPVFERHLERLGKLLEGDDDDENDVPLYRLSQRVRSQRRVQARVVEALFQRLRGAGFEWSETRIGEWDAQGQDEPRNDRERERRLMRADFVAARAGGTLVMEIKAEADREDVFKAVGQLAVQGRAVADSRRVLVLPAPRDPLGRALAPFEAAFAELDITVLMFDFKGSAVDLWMVRRGARIPDDVASIFPIMG